MVTPARKIAPLPEMGRLIWRRQYRGLLYHRGVHPSDYPGSSSAGNGMG